MRWACLGYIQDGTEHEWAEKLATELASPRHKILEDGGWEHLTIADAPPHAYRTLHTDRNDIRLLVLHVLLSFSRS